MMVRPIRVAMENTTVSVRVLSIHAGYACRHSGACCTAGWRIPDRWPSAEAALATRAREVEQLRSGRPGRAPSWVAYQGRGLRSVLASLAAALDVVRVEAVLHAARAARPLDRVLLVEALRAADLLLVHVASRDALARAWSRAEEHPAI